MPKLTLDHHPISLKFEKEEDLGPIMFRFNPLWIERDGFWETMTQAWAQYVEGSLSFVWEQKLKNTKYALKNWAKKPLNTLTSSRQEKVLELLEI